MKITGFDILYADAGWRNACFLKIMTDQGLVGWSEFSEHTGTAGISGVVREQCKLINGMDPTRIETVAAFLRGRTMQAGGGMNQHAIAAIVNALFDIKGKALGVPVHALFGGPVRDRVQAYWSHCGSYRIRHGALVGKPPVQTFDDIRKLGAEVRDRGFKALKTGMVSMADGKFTNFGPGFAFTPGWPAMNIDRHAIDTTVKMMEAFREGAGPTVKLGLDLNFHFKTEGYLEIVRALKDFNLLWLEIDSFDPRALSRIRAAATFPIASLEALFFRQGLKPYLDEGCADVGIIDVTWNGYLESVKMADFAAAYEVNVASHAYCAGGIADVMSAHFAAAVPNFRIMEYDVDDVPWKHEFLTNPLVIENGDVIIPQGPGWGTEVNEAALKKTSGEVMRPFEGIRVLDLTHVLAGPFAAYQLAVLGADVIKIEMPTEPDQTRYSGPDEALVDANMGAYYLTQGSNKRSMTIDLKTEAGREILKKLVATADIFLENYRPGAMEDIGLGYDDLIKINPKLIYASMSAFGQGGPRRTQTGYDQVIQASSGLMAASGTPDFSPLRQATPAIDYASGTTGAFALASALFQRERTGKGQHIDMAMLDVALILMGTHLTAYHRNGWHPKPQGNRFEFATIGIYQTKDGLLMIAAINLRQQKRLWELLGRPDLVKRNNRERAADREREAVALTDIMLTRTADEWENFFQSNHVPVGRIRELRDALADPQLASRALVHRFENAPGIEGAFSVPVAAFKLKHGGPRIDTPPPQFGEHNDAILAELGYSAADIEKLRADGAIGERP